MADPIFARLVMNRALVDPMTSAKFWFSIAMMITWSKVRPVGGLVAYTGSVGITMSNVSNARGHSLFMP